MLKYSLTSAKTLYILFLFFWTNDCFSINHREKLESIFRSMIELHQTPVDSLFTFKLNGIASKLATVESEFEESQLDKSYWVCRVWVNGKLYSGIKNKTGTGFNQDSICQVLKYYVAQAIAKPKTEEDYELLALYCWDLEINVQKINTWAQSELDQISCGCLYIAKSVSNTARKFKQLFNKAYKYNDPRDVKIDLKKIDLLIDDSNKLFIKSRYSPVIYEATLGLLYDARFYAQNKIWTTTERKRFIIKSLPESVKDCSTARGGYERALTTITSSACEINQDEKSIFSNVVFSNKALPSDSIFKWLNQKVILTKSCRFKSDTCFFKEQPDAENACKDCKDSEFNHNKASCKFCGCTDTMFVEGKEFVKKYPLIDQQIPKNSLCKTERRGCRNKGADNYCADCDIDAPELCVGDNLCGCLDSTKVNYAHSSFNKNHPYYKMYYNLKVTVPDSSYCIKKGGMDPCNKKYYHPKATESSDLDNKVCGCTDSSAINYNLDATYDDGSCLFERGPGPIDSLKKNLIDYLKSEYNDSILIKLVDKFLNFTRCGTSENCLQVSFDDPEGKAMIIGQGVYELGIYRAEFMERLAIALTRYFNHTTMLRIKMKKSTIRIVGEADGNPIRKEGIVYKGFGDINFKYRSIPNSVSIERGKDLLSLPLDRDRNHINIKQNKIIDSNKELAFLRAYGVANEFKELWSGEDQLMIGAKANNEKAPGTEGYKFRKVSFVIECPDFFTPVKVKIKQNLGNQRKEGTVNPGSSLEKQKDCKCEDEGL